MAKKVVNKLEIPAKAEWIEQGRIIDKILAECFPDFMPPITDDRVDFKGLKIKFHQAKRDVWSNCREPAMLREIQIERHDEDYSSYFKRCPVVKVEGTEMAYIDKDDFIAKFNEMAKLQAESDERLAVKQAKLQAESDERLAVKQAGLKRAKERVEVLADAAREAGLDFISLTCAPYGFESKSVYFKGFSVKNDDEALKLIMFLGELRKARK